MEKDKFVIGVDYGTDSVRSIIVNATNGQEIASAVFRYPRWKDGLYCDASVNRFRQHPLDYTEGLGHTIRSCLQQAGPAMLHQVAARCPALPSVRDSCVRAHRLKPPKAPPDFCRFHLYRHDPVRRRPDIGLARQTLGWDPTIGLDDGLSRTVEYFRDLLKS